MIVVWRGLFEDGLIEVEADRLEQDVEAGFRAECEEEAVGLEVVGAEIVDHGPAGVQQGLHVDHLEGPDPFVEDSPAGVEATGAVLLGASGAFQVVGAGVAEDERGSVAQG